ncbi:MAG: hypothetical protein ABFC56_06430 [Clostridiaceae bacterium]
MNLRVISPRLRFRIYLLIELLAVPFLVLYLYAGFSSLDTTVETVCWVFIIALQLFMVLSPLLIEKYSFGAEWFHLDASGVTYTSRKVTYHLDWAQVQHIMLSPDRNGSTTKNCFICFYAEELPRWLPMRSDYSPTAFGLQYRKGLPEIIAQYCDKEIYNLDAIEKSRR